VPHMLPYVTSKFALAGYAQGLRAELARDGISVTSVYPGLMRTGSPRNADFKGQHRREYAWFAVSDSLPGLTTNARLAARRIVAACEEGRAELVLGPPAKVLLALRALMPRAFAAALSLVNRLLPAADGAGTESFKGHESESAASTSGLTALMRRAEVRDN